MKSEFEEKEFEAPLYSELMQGHGLPWTPGQVFEGSFGIDAALSAVNKHFWNLTNLSKIPRGVILDHFNWGYIWNKINKRPLPNFNVNLLIQAKRPDHLQRVSSDLKELGFSGKHWRFEITPHQQLLLEKVSKKLKNKALIIYASPAFHTLNQLYDFTKKRTIVQNTNFVRIHKLTNHKRWNYNKPGFSGIAHSTPEFIDEKSFDVLFSSLEQNNRTDFFENAAEFYIAAHDSSVELSNTNVTARHYLSIVESIESEIPKEYIHLQSYISFMAFCNLTNLTWLMV